MNTLQQTKKVNISTINWGDIVKIDNVFVTVGKNDIKHGGFMGSTLFGDSYNLGSKLIEKIIV